MLAAVFQLVRAAASSADAVVGRSIARPPSGTPRDPKTRLIRTRFSNKGS
jgi:hypothetical protein